MDLMTYLWMELRFIARTRKPKHRFRPTPDSLILSLLVGEAPLALRSARLADTAQGLRFVDVRGDGGSGDSGKQNR
jgi:hypothetical protein